MQCVTVTHLRKDLFALLHYVIYFNELVKVRTKHGNAVIISEDDYNTLMTMLYTSLVPYMRETIIEGLHTPLSDCVSENEVSW